MFPLFRDLLDSQNCVICQQSIRSQERLLSLYEDKPAYQDIFAEARKLLCPTCLANLPYADKPWFYLPSTEIPVAWVFNYEGGLKSAHLRLKFSRELIMAKVFAIFWAFRLEQLAFYPKLIVPIPLSEKRLRQRGYNQAEVLANNLGNYLGLRVESDILERCKETLPQTEMPNIKARQANLSGAFRLNPALDKQLLKGIPILVLDDVFTTGATLIAAAQVLQAAGLNVRAMSLARQELIPENTQKF